MKTSLSHTEVDKILYHAVLIAIKKIDLYFKIVF